MKQARTRLGDASNETSAAVHALLFAACETAETVELLCSCLRVRDAFVAARTLIETLINANYILAKGDEAVAKAKRHALQKSFRNLHRSVKIGGLQMETRYSTIPKPEDVPELKAALDEFTSKKGRELTSWTPEEITDRLAVIGKVLGPKISTGLSSSFFAIYRTASDIAHGTLFSVFDSLGQAAPGPARSPEELSVHMRSNAVMILLMCSLGVYSTVEAVGTCTDVSDLSKRSDELLGYSEQRFGPDKREAAGNRSVVASFVRLGD